MMKLRSALFLVATHAAVGVLGFSAGIYVLPILTAPPAPSAAEVQSASAQTRFTTEFRKDLQGSDAFHWGEGRVSIGSSSITLMGILAPGPDYKLYLSPEFVETEEAFIRIKSSMVRVGDVKTFDNFVVEVPPGIDPSQYKAVVVWCESFGEFISAGQYQ